MKNSCIPLLVIVRIQKCFQWCKFEPGEVIWQAFFYIPLGTLIQEELQSDLLQRMTSDLNEMILMEQVKFR